MKVLSEPGPATMSSVQGEGTGPWSWPRSYDSPTERIITQCITSERITSERINTERITSERITSERINLNI